MSAALSDVRFPRTATAIGRLSPPYGHGAAYSRAVARYADELLPALLGGEWRRTPRMPPLGIAVTRGLLDHHEVFRRRDAQGATALGSIALIGQPYGQGADKAQLPSDAPALAAELAAQGLGVWTRRDLSAWFPGWTHLVVVARGLRSEDAQRWGFQALG